MPLSGGQHGRPIAETCIDDRKPWASKHRRALAYNYRSSPFYEYYEPRLAPLWENRWSTLGELTVWSVCLVHELLGAASSLMVLSGLQGTPARELAGVLDAFPASELVTSASAEPADARAAPTVRILRVYERAYRQVFAGFQPGLSVLDLIFNYGPESGLLLRQRLSID